MTDCTQKEFEFQALGRRRVVADFEGGDISSEGGILLVSEVEAQRGWLREAEACFVDHRDPRWIEHTVRELLSQRVLGLIQGYEDLNDHDRLRGDPLLAVACGKEDPSGQTRRCEEDRGKALAGKSTLHRLEHGQGASSRYKKVVCDHKAMERLFVTKFLDRPRGEVPERVVLDLDATHTPLHGEQEGRFFHGYYDEYCYLPLYMFCGRELLCAKLNEANADPGGRALREVKRVVEQIRAAWPRVQIVLRGDSGFCREELMKWCEENGVDYLFGLARNDRLVSLLHSGLETVRRATEILGQPTRCFVELKYQTLKSWSRVRRVVGKAEQLEGKANPRFVVTSLRVEEGYGARELYEETYCARGEMENRIKEQQLEMFATRTSTASLEANQRRLWMAALAYCMVNDLREFGLEATALKAAQCGTIRSRLLKVGAQVSISVRRVVIHLAQSFPLREIFCQALSNLRGMPLRYAT